jgi:citrate synthase
MSNGLIEAAEAAERLGVSRSTLYAYVSRGLVRSTAKPDDPRARLYAQADVEALLRRKQKMRRPTAAAATALDFGLPVLETRLTNIAGGRLFYRGRDAILLSETASLEETAAILWETHDDPFAAVDFRPERIAGWARTAALVAAGSATDRALALLPLLLREGGPVPGAPGAHRHAARLTLAVATAVVGGALPKEMPLHRAVAGAWHRPGAVDAIRRALVLCADHELNASAFAVRVAASTGATLIASLLAGLAALSGPWHGGMTRRVAAFLDEAAQLGDASAAVAARLARGDPMTGFGHPLYPDGDPRGAALLPHLPPEPARPLVAAVERATGLKPTIDVALAALERAHRLPAGAALGIFAIGRTIGWIAHAVEQRAARALIRPRARYTGPSPDVAS